MPKTNKNDAFDYQAFIAKYGGGTISNYRAKQPIYIEGDRASGIFYVISGAVEIVVSSDFGKEAVIAILDAGAFFGEACMDGRLLRTSTVAAVSDCRIARFERSAVMRALADDPAFLTIFLSFILGRSEKLKTDLVDHLFNSSEKRLARILLTLGHSGDAPISNFVTVPMNQEILAKMVGTTRSRINGFMNKFRKLGYISYNGKIEVHQSLFNVIVPEYEKADGR
jgi:CRP-like cAMP-binding protein